MDKWSQYPFLCVLQLLSVSGPWVVAPRGDGEIVRKLMTVPASVGEDSRGDNAL